jgi:hypothetical protein
MNRDPVFDRKVSRLHDLGPRPLAEILRELAEKWGAEFRRDLDSRLERYGRLPPEVVRDLGGDRFPVQPLRLVQA